MPSKNFLGITLDLGFSALSIESPDELQLKEKNLNFTFVDCPGHNSLIRTIIGGNLIIGNFTFHSVSQAIHPLKNHIPLCSKSTHVSFPIMFHHRHNDPCD